MFHFLVISKCSTVTRLWSVLAETRRLRRRFECEGLNYSHFYGIRTKAGLERELTSLRLREKLVERKIIKSKP